ncbi:hypothetical protein [uncultured Psychroserpens sp.]|uniref:hypothetical protein n=1 Tax=uncultured Psychroserpens sp. TaxID=255436 RepID=UPI0026184A92|nr:hypothetical protein [uncultured Psychroserpens sp.]
MNQTFKYSPPLKYILSIPLGLLGGLMFVWNIFMMPEWYVKIFTVIFASLGYDFHATSFKHIKGYRITIDNYKLKTQ